MCLGNWVWKWMEFVVGGERFFWLYDLKLGQAMRNLACGDLWIMLVQPVFMACQLSTCVCPFHLVDELVLVFYTAFCWRSFFGGGEQVSMVLVSWHNYTLPKEDPKNIWITWHHLWVLLTSVFFCRKSAIFAISGNKPLDT